MEALLFKVLSLGVAKLLKMCLALYMWVIATSPSVRAEKCYYSGQQKSQWAKHWLVIQRPIL